MVFRLQMLFLAFAVVCGAGDPIPVESTTVEVLPQIELDEMVEFSLKAGDRRAFGLEMASGETVRVVIDQRGVDVESTLLGSDGAPLGRMDSVWGAEGLEVLSAIVPSPGGLVLEIRAADQPGKLRITAERSGQATPAHWERIAADAEFFAATQLAAEGSLEALRAAAERYLKVAEAARRCGDSLQEASALASAASIWRRLGEPDRVQELLESERTASWSQIHPWLEAKRLETLGIIQQERRDHRGALELLGPAREIYRDQGYRRQEGYVLVRIRRCFLWLGELEKALEFARQGLLIWKELEDPGWQASALEDMGMLSAALGRLEQALEIYEESLPLWRASGNVKGEGETQNLMGRVHAKTGELQRALKHHKQALALMQTVGDHHGIAQSYSYTAAVHEALGDPSRALELHEKAVAETLAGDGEWEGLARSGLGRALRAAGELDRAKASFEKALVFFRKENIRWAEGMTLADLGSLVAARGDYLGALDAYGKAIEISRDLKDRPREANTTELMAAAFLAEEKVSEATAHFQKACELWRQLGESGRLAGALLGLAKAHEAAGALSEAISVIEESLAIRESTRGHLIGQVWRAVYLGRHRGGYEQLVDVLLELHGQHPKGGFLERAFETSERAHAKGLVELLLEARIDVRRGISTQLKSREIEIGSRISALQAGLIEVRSRGDAPKERVEVLEREMREAESRRRELEVEIRLNHPRYADLHYPLPVELDTVQRLLDERTALLEFMVGREGSVLFVVLRDRILSFRLAPEARLEGLVSQLRRAVSNPGRLGARRYLQKAYELWSELLEPALPVLEGVERVLVVPDGPLFSLPFEALLTSPVATDGQGVDFASLPYAGARWVMSSVSSASVLKSLGTENPSPPGEGDQRLLAFGDPHYMDEKQDGDPPQFDSDAELLARGVLGRDDAWPLPRLRFSAVEVRAIAELFEPGRSSVYLREAATEENAKAVLDGVRADAVHFATHALVSATEPQRSGLVLTIDEDPREDGLLQVFEIFNLKFDADLVVLSACETGLGKTIRGEGVIGLNRAFLYAGARSTIVSLWRVADASTAVLMQEFYKRVAAGEDKARALQRAKLELIKSRQYSHPFYWAPFVITGDPGAKTVTTTTGVIAE